MENRFQVLCAASFCLWLSCKENSLTIDQIKEGCSYYAVSLNVKSIFVFIVSHYGGCSFKRKKIVVCMDRKRK